MTSRSAMVGLGLVLGASVAASACDGGGDGGSAARVPCGAVGSWSDGAVELHRYTLGPRRQLAGVQVRDGAGAIVRDERRGWQGERVAWSERDGQRSVYDHDGTRLIRITRTDPAPGDGDDSAVTTYGYAGDAIVTQHIEYVDPARPDRHATITGDLTERLTVVDCPVTDATRCDTWIFEQPDRDPAHWTLATLDRGGDGRIDVRRERTLDEHGLELTYVETDLGPRGAVVRTRVTTTREPDGTALGSVRAQFAPDGSPLPSLQLVNVFTCPGRRDDRAAALAVAARRHPAPDDAGLVQRLLGR